MVRPEVQVVEEMADQVVARDVVAQTQVAALRSKQLGGSEMRAVITPAARSFQELAVAALGAPEQMRTLQRRHPYLAEQELLTVLEQVRR